MTPRRVAVVGHAQHITIARVAALPKPGDILHLERPDWFPGGGGAVAFHQLVKSPAQVVFFTAVGNDDLGTRVLRRLEETGATIHAARAQVPHSRDLVLITPDAERTIVVVDDPLQPARRDPLPWDTLGTCDAAFFTARDPDALRAARAARVLVVTARRAQSLRDAGVAADVVVGSANDPLEASTLADYPIKPRALVMTDGAHGGWVETAAGRERFAPAPAPSPLVSSYGAGDSFAGALTWYVAAGLDLVDACTRAAAHGAAVLAGPDPLSAQRPLA